MKVDVGRLTQDECFELVQDCIPNLVEENQWVIFKQLVEELGKESCQAELEDK